MPNPLLKPGDPRFQPSQIDAQDGQNRFADQAASETAPAANGDPYQTGAATDARPFEPHFESHQTPRLQLLIFLCIGAWLGAGLGALSLAGIFAVGWICPLLGLGPAAAASFIAYEDLKAIASGAIGEEHFAAVNKACYAGVSSLLACASVIGLMIYYQMQFLPDLF